jgi:hypothetical protein
MKSLQFSRGFLFVVVLVSIVGIFLLNFVFFQKLYVQITGTKYSSTIRHKAITYGEGRNRGHTYKVPFYSFICPLTNKSGSGSTDVQIDVLESTWNTAKEGDPIVLIRRNDNNTVVPSGPLGELRELCESIVIVAGFLVYALFIINRNRQKIVNPIYFSKND